MTQKKLLIAGATGLGLSVAVTATAWLAYSSRRSDAAVSAPVALSQVVVSKPLVREVDVLQRLQFAERLAEMRDLELARHRALVSRFRSSQALAASL